MSVQPTLTPQQKRKQTILRKRMAEIGRLGGIATWKKHGKVHYDKLRELGNKKRKKMKAAKTRIV